MNSIILRRQTLENQAKPKGLSCCSFSDGDLVAMYLNIVCCCIICLLVFCVGPGLIVLFFNFLVKKKELVALLYKCGHVTVCVLCLFLAGAKSWSVTVIFPGHM